MNAISWWSFNSFRSNRGLNLDLIMDIAIRIINPCFTHLHFLQAKVNFIFSSLTKSCLQLNLDIGWSKLRITMSRLTCNDDHYLLSIQLIYRIVDCWYRWLMVWLFDRNNSMMSKSGDVQIRWFESNIKSSYIITNILKKLKIKNWINQDMISTVNLDQVVVDDYN